MQKGSKGKWCLAKPQKPEITVDKNELRKRLTPLQYRVTQEKATERPYSGEYLKKRDEGKYTCVVCHEELFSSTTKYETSCGWPAFYDTVDTRKVCFSSDLSHVGGNLLLLAIKPDLVRTEVTCSKCGAHLGHVFDDGPKPTGKRYCINSAALNFKERKENYDENSNNNNSNNNNNNDSMTSKSFSNSDQEKFTENKNENSLNMTNKNKTELNEKNAINKVLTSVTKATSPTPNITTTKSFIPTSVKSPNSSNSRFNASINHRSPSPLSSVKAKTILATPATTKINTASSSSAATTVTSKVSTLTGNPTVRTRKLPITATPVSCINSKTILSVRNNLRSVRQNNEKPITSLLETNL